MVVTPVTGGLGSGSVPFLLATGVPGPARESPRHHRRGKSRLLAGSRGRAAAYRDVGRLRCSGRRCDRSSLPVKSGPREPDRERLRGESGCRPGNRRDWMRDCGSRAGDSRDEELDCMPRATESREATRNRRTRHDNPRSMESPSGGHLTHRGSRVTSRRVQVIECGSNPSRVALVGEPSPRSLCLAPQFRVQEPRSGPKMAPYRVVTPREGRKRSRSRPSPPASPRGFARSIDAGSTPAR